MRLLNQSLISDRDVLKSLRAVLPPKKRGEWRGVPRRLDVELIDDVFHGHLDAMELRIRAQIGDRSWFPYTRQKLYGEGYAKLRLQDPLEALVYVLGHEWRHLWQFWNPDLPRMNGGRGVFSEVDADAYAMICLHEWRK